MTVGCLGHLLLLFPASLKQGNDRRGLGQTLYHQREIKYTHQIDGRECDTHALSFAVFLVTKAVLPHSACARAAICVVV